MTPEAAAFFYLSLYIYPGSDKEGLWKLGLLGSIALITFESSIKTVTYGYMGGSAVSLLLLEAMPLFKTSIFDGIF